ncbi:MAG TPA: hypothetical protein RMH85_11465 [Polyangiaceae bacterium LLY-WYZ-15_(1-7)]|nr:hypothetical protein [Myxococcales bacterium]MAT28503.1 hypothetical protein [Sandaracinus sp.]HJK91804.1 hypothetical protein [Polyangiaceae bacterium LLY-WYZ-15_(1-7)]MBJ72733.1 hypothetical protein [Sandaracinus sp.]HJL00757.1 hypothetical protein [Polyangiaceae bacterium LLY-WYZ-15_(1-7)]
MTHGDGKARSRRELLRWLAAMPGGLLLAGCGDGGGGLSDAGGGDAGRADAGGGDAGGGDAGGGDAGIGADAGGAEDAGVCDPTTEDALGPFFEEGAPMRTQLAEPDEPGSPLRVEGRLFDTADCLTPLAGWGLDLWQADAEGVYREPPDFRLRGRMVTDAEGGFAFETIKPGRYRLSGSFRPAHLHLRVYAPDGGVRLTTQLYFAGDPFLGEADPCGPPTCFSSDGGRILPLAEAMVGGRPGELAMAPLYLRA